MVHYSEVFIGMDVSRDSHAVAVAEGRRRHAVCLHARPVLVLAIALPSETNIGARHVARGDALEAIRLDRPAQARQGSRPAVPATGLAVLRVVLRVVPVHLEVVHRRGGGLQARDGGDHVPLPLWLKVGDFVGRHFLQVHVGIEGDHPPPRRTDVQLASDELVVLRRRRCAGGECRRVTFRDELVSLVARIAEGHDISLPLQHGAQHEENERCAHDCQTHQPGGTTAPSRESPGWPRRLH